MEAISYTYVLPIEDVGLQSLFETIDLSTLDVIVGKIKRYKNAKRMDIYNIINPKLLQIVYPTPVPPDLDYISDREKRLKLWREISITYENEFSKIPSHLINVLLKHHYFAIHLEHHLL